MTEFYSSFSSIEKIVMSKGFQASRQARKMLGGKNCRNNSAGFIVEVVVF